MTEATTEPATILVTGATGNVGRHLTAELLRTGARVRALVRDPVAARLPEGVEAVRGDLARPETLDPALRGVDAVFLLWPFLSARGARPVVDRIAAHARRVVFLSAASVSDEAEDCTGGVWGAVERLIRATALEWTFLRPVGFAANTRGWAEEIRRDGRVRWPYGAASRSLIHEADVAAVAVRALVETRHAGATYVLTGPEPVSQREQVRVIGEVVGRPVRWEEISPEAAREQMLREWGDPNFVDQALRYWASLVEAPEPVTDTVASVTGVPARTFREWVADHARDFGVPTTEEVAEAYAASLRQGRVDEAVRWCAEDFGRTPPEPGGGDTVGRGMAEVLEIAALPTGDTGIHEVEIDGPFLRGDRFALRVAFEETHRLTGDRRSIARMCLYTVEGARIVREEVYDHTAPRGAVALEAGGGTAP